MENCTAAGLAAMTREARKIAESTFVSEDLGHAAETALHSLLKSMAIQGFKLVDGER